MGHGAEEGRTVEGSQGVATASARARLRSRCALICPSIRPAVGADLNVVAATVVAAVDQHVTDAGGAHFTEGDHAKPHLRPDMRTSEQALEHDQPYRLSITVAVSL